MIAGGDRCRCRALCTVPRLLGRTALDHEENPPLYGLRIRSNWLCQRTGKNCARQFEIEECACTQRYEVERVHTDVQDQMHASYYMSMERCGARPKKKFVSESCNPRGKSAWFVLLQHATCSTLMHPRWRTLFAEQMPEATA